MTITIKRRDGSKRVISPSELFFDSTHSNIMALIYSLEPDFLSAIVSSAKGKAMEIKPKS